MRRLRSYAIKSRSRQISRKWTPCTDCLLRGPGWIFGSCRVSQGIFPWLITLYQPALSQCGRRWFNLPSMAPHNLWTSKRKVYIQCWTDNGWKKCSTFPLTVAPERSEGSSSLLASTACRKFKSLGGSEIKMCIVLHKTVFRLMLLLSGGNSANQIFRVTSDWKYQWGEWINNNFARYKADPADSLSEFWCHQTEQFHWTCCEFCSKDRQLRYLDAH